ncbi:transmembrane anchor protein [Vibrio sp. HN007]|uniref:transmembrane anchor protein n=1 Tax=Vibrio iocasae TaxID=3098914 RepID=UPI0035D42375
MYNTDMPTRAELPTTKQLVRSTIIALVAAVTILVTIVLPSEYAIDPTGVGRVLGLTEMGEIKAQLADEAARDKAITNNAELAKVVIPEKVATAEPTVDAAQKVTKPEWRDKIMLTLKPGQGAEVKMVMNKGQVATFQWVSKGGPVNYDTHGDGNGNSISYEKGRGVPQDEGELVAAFTGNHGWFFRNRNDKTVMVILRANGEYAEMKRVL